MLRLFALLFVVSISVSQENKQDSVYVNAQNEEILRLRQTGNYRAALDLNDSLLEKLEAFPNTLLYAKTIHTRSRVEIDLGSYDDAIAHAKQAKEVYKRSSKLSEVAAIDNIIGVGFYFKSQLDSTLYYYNQSFLRKKELNVTAWQLAISAYNLGIVYEDLANYDEAIAIYMEAVDLLKVDPTEANFLSDIYLAIANTYKHKNDLVKALEFTTLALNEGLGKYGNDDPNISFVFESYAGVQQALGNFEVSEKYTYDLIKIREKYYGKEHKWTAQGYSDLSEILLIQKKNDSALWAIEKAISIEKKVNNEVDFGDIYLHKSKILSELIKYDDALNCVHKSREFYIKVYGEAHKSNAATHLQEAKIYLQLENILAVKNSLKAVYKSIQYDTSDLTTLSAPFIVAEALQLEFKIEADPVDRMKIIDQQISLVNHIKNFYQTSEAKIFYNASTSSNISEYVDFCFRLFQETNKLVYFDKALELVQLATNSVLAEERQNIVFTKTKDGEQAFRDVTLARQHWARVNQDLYYEESAAVPNKLLLDSLLEKRIVVSRDLDRAIKIYEKFSSEVSKLQVFSLNEIKEKLKNDQQLLQYYVGKEDVYVFVITAESYQFLKLGGVPEMRLLVNKLREQLIIRNSVLPLTTLLYDFLTPKEMTISNPNLIVIPDGILAYVPFEILTDSAETKLLENYAVSYNSALSFIVVNNERMQEYPNYWSGFGVTYNGNKSLSKSKEEIEIIGQLTEGKLYLNEAVTKEQIFHQARKSRILHLALHGVINENNPLYSEFILEDEKITASEIYNQKVFSSLVVLSACETGYGTIQKGEGVMSLSRAFSYAGASSTLMSLWEVPDQQTAKLMSYFYKHLEEGEATDVALKKAKLDFVNNSSTQYLKHPYYWAGFVVSGDTFPLKKPPFYKDWLWIVLSIFIVVLYWVFYRKRKQSIFSENLQP